MMSPSLLAVSDDVHIKSCIHHKMMKTFKCDQLLKNTHENQSLYEIYLYQADKRHLNDPFGICWGGCEYDLSCL